MNTSTDLPHEIWVMILQYVPLEDRLCHVQLVCKKFYMICNDSFLNARLDFEGCIFMPNRKCLQLIQKAKKHLKYLSFRNCLWFSHDVYAKFPICRCLRSLDLLGCFPNGKQLHIVLNHTPTLENLNLSITGQQLLVVCELPFPPLRLKVLHIDCIMPLPNDSTFVSSAAIRRSAALFINHCCHDKPDSISVYTDARTVIMTDFLSLCKAGQSSELAINLDPIIVSSRTLDDDKKLHEMLKVIDIRCSNASVQFISLPIVECCHSQHPVPHNYTSQNFFPSLKCLVACPGARSPSYHLNSSGLLGMMPGCSRTTINRILFEGIYPNLEYLNFGKQLGAPSTLYQSLNSLRNLKELNVAGLHLDLFKLLDSIKDLHHLTGLSIFVDNSINNKLEESGGIDIAHLGKRASRLGNERTTFFSQLVATIPRLKKLEITGSKSSVAPISAESMMPIGDLPNLELFSLRDIVLIEMRFLEKILERCSKLTSVSINMAGKRSHCEYSQFIRCFERLPCLRDLRLMHSSMELTSVFKHISCRKLWRLHIETGQQTTTVRLLHMLTAIIKNSPNLYLCIINHESAAESVSTALKKLQKEMKEKGRNIMLCLENRGTSSSPVAISYIQRSFSNVATIYPYDFFVSS